MRVPRVRSAVTNGRRLHVAAPGDGAWARRFRDVLEQIVADLSGPEGLSEGQRQLARRATTIAIACERLEGEAAAGSRGRVDATSQVRRADLGAWHLEHRRRQAAATSRKRTTAAPADVCSLTPLAIDKVLTDTRLLGGALGNIETWATWIIALKAAFASPLTYEERNVFTAIAGNRGLPRQRVRELWCVAGRRGGKSRMAAALAIYFALFIKHKLAAGEKGLVLVLAMTIDQSKVVFDYTLGFMRAPALAKEIESTTRSEIRLRNGITIAVHANSFRSVRGRTLCAAVFDEVAYWRDARRRRPTRRPTLRCCPRWRQLAECW